MNVVNHAPADPTTAPTDPTTAPANPTTAPADPTTAAADPTIDAITDPTNPPTNITDAPTDPTEAPTDPTDAPTNPTTDAPTDPTTDAYTTTTSSIGTSTASIESLLCQDYYCSYIGPEVLERLTTIHAYELCETACSENFECTYFTFTSLRNRPLCYLLSSCVIKPPCSDTSTCQSGHKECA